jgi:hypothetical protein
MVEVFKTTVQTCEDSKIVLQQLLDVFPNYLINFDLEDCDKILRVENTEGGINISGVQNLLLTLNFDIELL